MHDVGNLMRLIIGHTIIMYSYRHRLWHRLARPAWTWPAIRVKKTKTFLIDCKGSREEEYHAILFIPDAATQPHMNKNMNMIFLPYTPHTIHTIV
jgi:hypothetical protein